MQKSSKLLFFGNSTRRHYSNKVQVITTIAECKQFLKQHIKSHNGEKKLGFIPTMGALHNGHLTLVQRAKQQCEHVAVSIFVNPTQFGPNEDYGKYPRTLQSDTELLQSQGGVDFIFAPEASEMYPLGLHSMMRTSVHETGVEKHSMESTSRPGHFAGVCTVVTKLFNIVEPSVAYFGAKDAVQCIAIKNMVHDLNMNVNIEIVETMREANGLAMSSRNSYLSGDQKARSSVIFESLMKGKAYCEEHSVTGANVTKHVNKIKDLVEKTLQSEPMITDILYISCMDALTAAELGTSNQREVPSNCSSIVLSLAVKMDKVRLIDNITIHLSPSFVKV